MMKQAQVLQADSESERNMEILCQHASHNYPSLRSESQREHSASLHLVEREYLSIAHLLKGRGVVGLVGRANFLHPHEIFMIFFFYKHLCTFLE